MTDTEWAFFEPFVITTGGKSGRPPEDHRRVLDGVFWIARTGAPWRDLHEYFGKWSSVYRQFRRWTLAGIWELMLRALNENEGPQRGVQMIDSTVVRAHHQAAGAKGGLREGLSGILCAGPGYPSGCEESVFEDDGKLGLCNAPFAWRHFPVSCRPAQDQEQ